MHRKIQSWVLDCKINALIDHTIIITVYIRLYIFLKNDLKKQEMKHSIMWQFYEIDKSKYPGVSLIGRFLGLGQVVKVESIQCG